MFCGWRPDVSSLRRRGLDWRRGSPAMKRAKRIASPDSRAVGSAVEGGGTSPLSSNRKAALSKETVPDTAGEFPQKSSRPPDRLPFASKRSRPGRFVDEPVVRPRPAVFGQRLDTYPGACHDLPFHRVEHVVVRTAPVLPRHQRHKPRIVRIAGEIVVSPQRLPERGIAFIGHQEHHRTARNATVFQMFPDTGRLGQPARILMQPISAPDVHGDEPSCAPRQQLGNDRPCNLAHAPRGSDPQTHGRSILGRHAMAEHCGLDAPNHQDMIPGRGGRALAGSHRERRNAGVRAVPCERQRVFGSGEVHQSTLLQIEVGIPLPLVAEAEIVVRAQSQRRKHCEPAGSVRFAKQPLEVAQLMVQACRMRVPLVVPQVSDLSTTGSRRAIAAVRARATDGIHAAIITGTPLGDSRPGGRASA